ncbi:MAG TPA: restriction endonuclease subunit S, partial [Chryseolinea sp.]|nr:restriction endonuclease subunit S [Chryseolinea sp.]
SITTGNKDTVDNVKDGVYPFFVRSQTIERINTYTYDGEAVLTAGDGVGVAKVFHYIDGKFDYHQRTYKFADFKYISGKFFFYYMKSNLHKEVLMLSAKSTVDSLRFPMLQNFIFAIPPTEEQSQIVSYIETKTAALDHAIFRTEREIALMQEYRTRLVSDVVTGKIDVRDIEIPDIADIDNTIDESIDEPEGEEELETAEAEE